jgi:hypothetical protein
MARHDQRGAPDEGSARPRTPAAPVSIARCASYDEDVTAKLATLFDQLGGIGGLVRNKTVTVKLNMTGDPGIRFQGQAPGVTHYVHPKLVGATAYLWAAPARGASVLWKAPGPPPGRSKT